MTLREEWKELLLRSNHIYIYGAGKIGKQIYKLIKISGEQQKVRGYIVSNIKGNPQQIESVPVLQINEVEDKDSDIFVAVTDAYQEEILELLKSKSFEKVKIAYKFIALAEEGDYASTSMPNAIMIDTRELCRQQFGEEPRLDIIVRILAIEEYHGVNNYGFALYNKMMDKRIREGYSIYAERRFKELIKSFENDGYDENSEIFVDNELHLINGAHRLALAIYHRQPEVCIRIFDKRQNVQYGPKWFSDNLSEFECNLIHNKFVQVIESCFCPIVGILWPSAKDYFEEITKLVDEKYGVLKYRDYEMPWEIFSRFVYGVYNIDSIAEWKVAAKLEHMKKHTMDQGLCSVRIVKINMEYPDYRIKSIGQTISKEGEKLKKRLREKYKGKIENYFSDIIFHTADNYRQSEYIMALEDEAFSMHELIERIRDCRYMLIKSENDYFPKDFPMTYPKYKDIDIICDAESFQKLRNITMDYLSSNVDDRYTIKEIVKYEGNVFIRVELEGFLIFGIDLFASDPFLCDQFIEKSLKHRIQKGSYFVSSQEDDIVYRIVELYRNPQKERHLRFIKENWKEHYAKCFLQCIRPQYEKEFESFILSILKG